MTAKGTTKQEILDAAPESFSMQGYEAASISQLTEAVGIRKASLYSHFENKQAILDALIQTTMEEYEKHSIFVNADWDDLIFTKDKEKMTPETVIGVRTPLLRKMAKEFFGTLQAEEFLRSLQHSYYEENNLHAFLIEQIRDYDTALAETERFLPYIDNWATCDCFCPKIFAKHKAELLKSIRRQLASDQLYTVRYAIGMLMRHYLDEAFRPEFLDWVAGVQSEEYYVNMMRAWYFATALAKQPNKALPWLTERRLDVWTHNKTIQKAVESYRISAEMKQQLRGMRIQNHM